MIFRGSKQARKIAGHVTVDDMKLIGKFDMQDDKNISAKTLRRTFLNNAIVMTMAGLIGRIFSDKRSKIGISNENRDIKGIYPKIHLQAVARANKIDQHGSK